MAHSLFNKHIISIPELTRNELELIVDTAARLKAEPNPELLKNKVVASCFFEPSTRTRLSFETAVQRLGGTVIGFDNGGNTSLAKKGETLADSVQVISSYVDAFVMRHPQEGAARLASEFSNGVPVVNGGDGANQHPTQTLLDLFSIYETQGTLDNLNVAFVGDLKYGRTVHSLTQALSKFNNVRFFFIAPEVLEMPDYICEELEEMGIQYSTHSSIEEVVPELDVLSVDDELGNILDSESVSADSDNDVSASASDLELGEKLDLSKAGGDASEADLAADLSALTAMVEDEPVGEVAEAAGDGIGDVDSLDDALAELNALVDEGSAPSTPAADQDPISIESLPEDSIEPAEAKEEPVPAKASPAAEISFGDVLSTQLDLARAYIDMGDKQEARRLLGTVLSRGSEQQVAEAHKLLKELG